MSRIDDLIAEDCPGGVAFMPLANLIKLNFGTRITKRENSGTRYPVYGGGGESFRTDNFNREDEYVISRFAMSAKCVRRVAGRFWMLDSGFTFDPIHTGVDKNFMAYVLFSMQPEIYACSSEGAQKNLKTEEFMKFRVPVPPLVVQREIAAILEKMESLQAELQAELQARARQYAHYRDSLLRFPDSEGVRWATLGDVCAQISSGATPTAGRAEYYEGGTIPWLRTQEVRFVDVHETAIRITEQALAETAVKWIPKDCVVIAISGATAGRSAVNKIPMTTNQHCCNLAVDGSVANYRFVYQWVRANYETLKGQGQGARSDLNMGMIKRFPIPIPSLGEQQRIASILDAFDALVGDLSFGLPAEIEARRKQYEYYRDRLLTFEEKVA